MFVLLFDTDYRLGPESHAAAEEIDGLKQWRCFTTRLCTFNRESVGFIFELEIKAV